MRILLIGITMFILSVPGMIAQDSTAHEAHRSGRSRWAVGLHFGNFGPDDRTNPLLYPYSFYNRPASQTNYACTGGLTLSYRLYHSLNLRLRIGYSHPVQSSHIETDQNMTMVSGQQVPQTIVQTEDIVRQEKVYFAAFGFSKQLAVSRRYNLHAGLEGIFLIYNGKKGEAKSQEYVYNSPPMPNPYRNQKSVYTGEQAYSIGINSFVGFDIRLCRYLLLGSDFSIACLYTNLYGSRSEEFDQYGPSMIPSTETTIIPRHVKTFGFTQISYTMNLTYLF